MISISIQSTYRRWISFVKGTKGKVTTHTDMIQEAKGFLDSLELDWDHAEYTKDKDEKGHPTRSRIYEHMSDILTSELSTNTTEEDKEQDEVQL